MTTDPHMWPDGLSRAARRALLGGDHVRLVKVDSRTAARHTGGDHWLGGCFAADGACPVCWEWHYPQLGARHRKEIVS